MAERRGKYRLWQSGHHVSAASIEQVLQAARTDYTDFGLVHCIDEEDDYRRVMARGGLFDYMRSLKAQGVVRHLGFSTHTPSIARRFMETGETDLFMFSLNPTYDYSRGQLSYGRGQERLELYQEPRNCALVKLSMSWKKIKEAFTAALLAIWILQGIWIPALPFALLI